MQLGILLLPSYPSEQPIHERIAQDPAPIRQLDRPGFAPGLR